MADLDNPAARLLPGPTPLGRRLLPAIDDVRGVAVQVEDAPGSGAADRQGCPNIGTLMFLPCMRVLPMHLMIIFGVGMLEGGPLALLLFGVLKTAAGPPPTSRCT